MIYAIHRDKYNDILPCDSCGMAVPTAEFHYNAKADRQFLYCRFCVITGTDVLTEQPSPNATEQLTIEMWRAKAAIHNYLTFPELTQKDAQ